MLEGCQAGVSDPLCERGTSFTLPRGVAYSLVERLRATSKRITMLSAVRSHVSDRSAVDHGAAGSSRALAAGSSPDASSGDASIFHALDAPVEGSVRTPLALCCDTGLVEVTALLLLAGADPDVPVKASGETPLFLACSRGRAECVALLLMANADPGKARRDGYTPSQAAEMSNHRACCELIEVAGTLPRPPLFTAAVLDRARSLLLPPPDGRLLGAPPIDERTFERCLARAQDLGAPKKVLAAMQVLAKEAKTARLYKSNRE